MTTNQATDRKTQIKALADFCGVTITDGTWNPFKNMEHAFRVEKAIGDGHLWGKYLNALWFTTLTDVIHTCSIGNSGWHLSEAALFRLVNATAPDRADAAFCVITGKSNGI